LEISFYSVVNFERYPNDEIMGRMDELLKLEGK